MTDDETEDPRESDALAPPQWPARRRPPILAIDDDAERYGHLRSLLGDRVELVIASCSSCVYVGLGRKPSAVLLDFDLDLLPCPGCGADTGAERTPSGLVVRVNAHGKGVLWTPLLADVPVIVTSMAGRVADRMAAAMRASGHDRVARISAGEPDPEIRWIGQLWTWGVL